jgi:hypothetical protein
LKFKAVYIVLNEYEHAYIHGTAVNELATCSFELRGDNVLLSDGEPL